MRLTIKFKPLRKLDPIDGDNGQMKTASISATKNQLSALIEQVRHGETIPITDHDRPVARLIPAATENGQSSPDELALLERKGILRRGHGKACCLAPPSRASATRQHTPSLTGRTRVGAVRFWDSSTILPLLVEETSTPSGAVRK